MKERSEYRVRNELDAPRRETVLNRAVVAQGIGHMCAFRIALVEFWVGIAMSVDFPRDLFEIGQQLTAAWIDAQPDTAKSGMVLLVKGAEQGVHGVQPVHQGRIRSRVQKPCVVVRARCKQFLD